MRFLFEVTWTLVYWEEEMSTSVHSQCELIDIQHLEEKALCKVRFGKEVYEGKIAAIGNVTTYIVTNLLN